MSDALRLEICRAIAAGQMTPAVLDFVHLPDEQFSAMMENELARRRAAAEQEADDDAD
ncbi:MAG: hypothetical protein KDE35_15650 [Geminicoccaceae bacterium]|nr:hypothetical protein [Geminicoccaceae bacterium]